MEETHVIADTANAGPSRPGQSRPSTRDNGVVGVRHDRSYLQKPAELHRGHGAGPRLAAGAGTKSRRVRSVLHSGAGELEVDAAGRSRFRRPDRQVGWSGPILQHGSRENAEGQGHHDADSHRLEGQRLGGLYIGRSNTAGVYCGRAHRRQLGRDGLRSGDRPIPNIESE